VVLFGPRVKHPQIIYVYMVTQGNLCIMFCKMAKKEYKLSKDGYCFSKVLNSAEKNKSSTALCICDTFVQNSLRACY